MNFFGYPIEIWLASFVAVMFKLKNNSNISIVGTITTVAIAMFSGLIMYRPIVEIINLAPSWNVPVAILVAITAESFMKQANDISSDKDFVKDWLKYILARKIEYKEKDKEKETKVEPNLENGE